MTDTKILEVTPDVKWIGVLDTDIVTFDVVMETKYGTTYNSYFIDAEKKPSLKPPNFNFGIPIFKRLSRFAIRQKSNTSYSIIPSRITQATSSICLNWHPVLPW